MRTLLVTLQKSIDAIGLKYIHSYLIENHIDSHILFIPQYQKKDTPSIMRFLEDFKPRIIGISLMSEEFDKAKEVSTLIKEKFPEIIIVWGGIHPTIDPKGCLNHADYIFRGESEQAYLEFVNAISKNKPVQGILNLGYKSPKGSHLNPLRGLTKNLDELPFPEYLPQKSFILHNGTIVKFSKSIFRRYARYSGRFYSLITSRGCPFSCAYCCNSAFSKLYGTKKIRKRSVENVLKEIKHGIELFPDLVYLNIHDDNFLSYDIAWMKAFAETAERDIKKKIICRSTPAHLSEEKILLLKKAGLSWIFMGLQSGSPRINQGTYKRFVSNEKFIEATKLVKKNNVAGWYDVILDNPYETEEDVIETLNVVLKIPRPFMLQLFSLCFYQGTEIYDRALKENLAIEDPLKKNYAKYKPTFLNKVIRLSPLYPKKVIESLVNNRKKRWAKILVDLISFPSILILEPLVWFRLILISFDNNLLRTITMIFAFFKTGFKKMMLRDNC